MANPRVSFVVPTYNYATWVTGAIDSLLAQTFTNLEVIVIDDASTDSTPRRLERYADEPRVRLVRHEVNRGHIATYNEGLAAARGEFLGLLSADDVCLRDDAVERQVGLFERDPSVGFVFSRLAFIDEFDRVTESWGPYGSDGVHAGIDEFRRLLFGNYIPASGTLVRASAHHLVGYYDARLRHAADWDLWLQLAVRYRVGYVADAAYGYRRHSTNMHHQVVTPRAADDDHVLVLERAFDALAAAPPADIDRLRRSAFRVAMHRRIDAERQRGYRAAAWRQAGGAVRRFPELLVQRAFLGSMAKLTVVSALGPGRALRLYAKLKPAGRARSAGRGFSKAQSA